MVIPVSSMISCHSQPSVALYFPRSRMKPPTAEATIEVWPVWFTGLLAVIVQSPNPLGRDAIPALEGMPLEALTASAKLKPIERRMVGADQLVRLIRS